MVETSSVLIFSGPHGAGKDTLESAFRYSHPSTERIVRHITRSAAPGEMDGKDYHFVSTSHFDEMVQAGDFIDHAAYPDCQAGTSYGALIQIAERAQFASTTTNLEEGLALHSKLGDRGLRSICFFVSPVPYETMKDEPEAYLASLRTRMEQRGRPNDRIENKLAKAALYRDLYFQHELQLRYIPNVTGDIDGALQATRQLVLGQA